MARLKDARQDVGLRQALVEFCETVLLPVMVTCDGFAESVAQLKAGGEFTFHRYELPDGHPARRDGEPGDYLTLGADDVLRPEPS